LKTEEALVEYVVKANYRDIPASPLVVVQARLAPALALVPRIRALTPSRNPRRGDTGPGVPHRPSLDWDRLPAQIRQAVRIPLLAIGGITCQNVAEVIAAGADGIAVISAVAEAPDMAAAAAELRRCVAQARRARRPEEQQR